ncbi:MAG: DUF192 domain-containing protein [Gemmatimonadota bacterium]|nr:DUF192 domain-containing protein [Gemmatimonadota bacterium]
MVRHDRPKGSAAPGLPFSRTLIGALLAALLSGCSTAEGEASGADREATPTPATGVSQVAPRPPRGSAWIIFGADTVVAEVARTPDDRQRGLMFREAVPDGTGMLFVFEEVELRSFWMKDTYVALDIAYLDAAFTIVDIQQMEPQTVDPHDSAAPAMFALEVRMGWFAEHGIEVGTTPSVVFGS